MSASNNYTGTECCNAGFCTGSGSNGDDDSFTPLNEIEAIRIRKYFNDPVLDENIKYIYECHGDPSGNMIYVGGASADEQFCIYIKYKKTDEINKTKILRCNSILHYAEQLAILDQELFNQ